MESTEFLSARPRRIGAMLSAALLLTAGGCTGDDEVPFAGELPPPGSTWETLDPALPDIAGDGAAREPGATGQAPAGTGGDGLAAPGSGGIGQAAPGSG